MAFYVVDYKDSKVGGPPGKEVFKGKTMRSAEKWLQEHATPEELNEGTRYVLDMDPDTYKRWERRQMQKARN